MNLAHADEDWESLSVQFKDAIDRMLIDEVRSTNEETIDLETLLADSES
jgi:hypothetical protein